jgi:hypothetical protein
MFGESETAWLNCEDQMGDPRTFTHHTKDYRASKAAIEIPCIMDRLFSRWILSKKRNYTY